MKYYYEQKTLYLCLYGQVYECEHPVYSKCTLYLIDKKGLAVIQQRFSPDTKSTYWTDIDPWIVDDIYMQKGFLDYFNTYAKEPENDIYPTVTLRQIMWKLRMKPLKRERWETVFDRSPI